MRRICLLLIFFYSMSNSSAITTYVSIMFSQYRSSFHTNNPCSSEEWDLWRYLQETDIIVE